MGDSNEDFGQEVGVENSLYWVLKSAVKELLQKWRIERKIIMHLALPALTSKDALISVLHKMVYEFKRRVYILMPKFALSHYG